MKNSLTPQPTFKAKHLSKVVTTAFKNSQGLWTYKAKVTFKYNATLTIHSVTGVSMEDLTANMKKLVSH